MGMLQKNLPLIAPAVLLYILIVFICGVWRIFFSRDTSDLIIQSLLYSIFFIPSLTGATINNLYASSKKNRHLQIIIGLSIFELLLAIGGSFLSLMSDSDPGAAVGVIAIMFIFIPVWIIWIVLYLLFFGILNYLKHKPLLKVILVFCLLYM